MKYLQIISKEDGSALSAKLKQIQEFFATSELRFTPMRKCIQLWGIMAQGKLKAKIQLPKGAKQKGGHQKKHLGPKKGGKILWI